VEDSLSALQELAKFHRKYLNLPIIALTGSNGKTTTKELIHVVLSKNIGQKQRLVTSIIISACL
jgi:UDP-N-acetylmuramoyl-tripeptide--D-alanyl-D-alanine ligase